MKTLVKNLFPSAYCMLLLILCFNSCKKDDEQIPPVNVVTTEVEQVTPASAVCKGKITSPTAQVLSSGICWSINTAPTLADHKMYNSSKSALISVCINRLQPNTNYYYRAFATSKTDTVYGETMTFKTPDGVIDIDGNGYTLVKIGTQTWMAQNLKVTHFANGDSIPCITDSIKWGASSSPACCDYNNSPETGNTYGKLYNYMAVTNSRGLCPEGWHVPTYSEWIKLDVYLGGGYYAGGKLKEAGTTHWRKTQPEVKDSLGFNALPGGWRNYNDGVFGGLGVDCIFWSSSPESLSNALGMSLVDSLIYSYTLIGPKLTGLSVRCLKN